ncbi:MAG: TniQ family protein [Nitrospira sp.]|nr:TniQ family protein [Nitrospira sp.]
MNKPGDKHEHHKGVTDQQCANQQINYTPFHSNTGDAESLSGYLQRLAQLIYLPAASLLSVLIGPHQRGYFRHCSHFYTNLRRIDCLPPPIERLSEYTQQPAGTLEGLTFIPLFTAFNGRDRLTSTHLTRYFFPYTGQRPIAEERRWCPLCLEEHFYYRLCWQLNDLLICPIHQVYLLDRCGRCGHVTSVMSGRSYFGHCDHCRFPLLDSVKTQPARGAAFLKEQRRVYDDFLYLWSHRRRQDGIEGKAVRNALRRRLRTLRLDRNVSLRQLFQLTSRSVAPIDYAYDWTIPLVVMLKLRSFYQISFRELSTVAETVAHNHAAPTVMSIACTNPWCAIYGQEIRIVWIAYARCCSTCGARIICPEEKNYGVPTRHMLQGLFTLYREDTRQELPLLERFRKAGLPSRTMSLVMKRLRYWGLAQMSSKHGWSLCHETSVTHWGFPVTPAIALLFRSKDPEVLMGERTVLSAIDQLWGRGERVTLDLLAKELNLTRINLRRLLARLPEDRRTQIITYLKIARQRLKQYRMQQGLKEADRILQTLIKDGIPITKHRVSTSLRFRLREAEYMPHAFRELYTRIDAAIREQLRERRERLRTEMVKAANQVWSSGMALSRAKVGTHLGVTFIHDKELDSWYWDLKALERGHYPSCSLAVSGEKYPGVGR